MIKCPVCQKKNTEEALFCKKCGVKMSSAIEAARRIKTKDSRACMLCMSCGAENVNNSTYCIKCGSLLVTPERQVISSQNAPMKVIRNIAFAIVSFVALDFIYWAYTSLLVFIVVNFLDLSILGIIVCYLVFGSLIFGFSSLVAVFLATGYGFICKIGTNGKFVKGWTISIIIVCILSSCFQIWPTLVTGGLLGIIGGIIITSDLIMIGVMLGQSSALID